MHILVIGHYDMPNDTWNYIQHSNSEPRTEITSSNHIYPLQANFG